jgi:hypothetical protein
MKPLKIFNVAVVLLGLMSQAASAQQPQCLNHLQTLTVTAWIDGRDLLFIHPGKLSWHHLDYAAPGRLGGANLPTKLLMSHSRRSRQDVSWIPDWPCPPENYECRDLQVKSSNFLMGLRLPSKYQLVDMQIVRAREQLRVKQYPSADNHYTTIIDFNDNNWGGADWYEVQLTFGPVQ